MNRHIKAQGPLSCGIDPVHRITPGDGLDFSQRRVYGERKVPSSTVRDSHILPEDGGPPLGWHRDKVNSDSAPLTDNGVAMRGLDIPHPVGIRTEHRYEVTFTVNGGDHHRVRSLAAGLAISNFEGGLEVRREPEAGPPAVETVDPQAETRRAPVAIQQAH
jgi:hypothetical protein